MDEPNESEPAIADDYPVGSRYTDGSTDRVYVRTARGWVEVLTMNPTDVPLGSRYFDTAHERWYVFTEQGWVEQDPPWRLHHIATQPVSVPSAVVLR